jgi:hypothetical protein
MNTSGRVDVFFLVVNYIGIVGIGFGVEDKDDAGHLSRICNFKLAIMVDGSLIVLLI